MTYTQLVILLGAIWLAPHLNNKYCIATGAVFTTIGALKLWGLI